MKIIRAISDQILEKWNIQRHIDDEEYKPIIYLREVEVDEGILLYNLMTFELVLITKKEYDSFCDGTLKEYNRKLYHFFITHWFMIPEYADERTMVYTLDSAFVPHKYLNRYIDTFTIFTTTDCNARCFYCYEKGVIKTTMSEQTAHDVAKYIIKRADPNPTKNKNTRLAWFGGEPLYNSKVIDIICSDLKEAGISYHSTMISNSYLFDEEMIEKAISLWKLERVQVTIDGTKDIYNKTKAYIYKDDKNPFDRIIRNIDLLSKNNISVGIRLNTTEKNVDDMYAVVDILYDKFKNSRRVKAYATPLFENVEKNPLVRTVDERKSIYDKVFELESYIASKGLYIISNFATNFNYSVMHCMVDNPGSCIISPDGNIGSCEHFPDSDFYGTIYDHRIGKDYDKIRSWKYVNQRVEKCKTCYYYPRCRRHKRCEIELLCDENTRKEDWLKLGYQIKSTFIVFKNQNQEIVDDFAKRHADD